jgi:hypothetical protein
MNFKLLWIWNLFPNNFLVLNSIATYFYIKLLAKNNIQPHLQKILKLSVVVHACNP